MDIIYLYMYVLLFMYYAYYIIYMCCSLFSSSSYYIIYHTQSYFISDHELLAFDWLTIIIAFWSYLP